MQWHSLYLEEIYTVLRSGERGLSSAEAEERFRQYGPNEFERFKKKTAIGIFFAQFKGAFILILLVAGIIALVLGDISDAVIIFAVVLLNSAVGSIQEYRADRTFQLLQRSLEELAVVVRDGEEKVIPAREVVPGDIVIIERGKRIPADARIIEARGLLVDESALTGEWLAVKKEPSVLLEDIPLPDRTNILYLGTVADDGASSAVVVQTGGKTEFGKIGARLQAAYDVRTPLEKSLRRFSLTLGITISALVLLLFFFGTFSGIPPLQMFLSSVALAVAAVPEGLAISLTIILAIGMRRILERRGLTRQLFAAETLGSVSTIATDKTGTITQARMQVSHILTGSRELLRDGDHFVGLTGASSEESHLLALKFAAAASEAVIENPEAELEAYRIRGRPTDRALTEAALEAGIRKDDLVRRGELLDTLSFDETRKFSAALLRGEPSHTLALVGAPEKLLAHSRELHIDGKTASLKSENFARIKERYEELVALGLRVVAVAHKSTRQNRIDADEATLVRGLTFVGFIAMRDPVRREVKEAIAISREAGIRTVIVTGDHALTARAIARDVGLDIPEGATVEGKELETMSDADLQKRAGRTLLFARVSPEHKVRIVEALQKNGEAVAMVGDGINDAPALKRADIGVALGSGTDIAKDASDLVLLDNSFATIVAAIREGRIILDNIRKTLVFLLTDGFSEIIIVGLSILLHLPLPLLPAQILWINLVEDSLPALSLAFEKGDGDLMARKPEKKMRLLDAPLAGLISFFAVVSSLTAFGLFWWFYQTNGSLDHARTMAMVLIGADSLFYIFSVKNFRISILHGRFFDNTVLLFAVVFGFVLLTSAVYLPFLRELLGTVPLSVFDWGLIFGFGIFSVVLTEVLKYLFILRARRARNVTP